MTTEEILKPRIKILADWPGVAGKVKAGDVINCDDEFDEPMFWIAGEAFLIDKIRDYPHLFREMEWWEERDEEEMPEYIKPIKAQQYVFKIYTVVEDRVKFENRNGDFSIEKLSAFIPATREEYEQYISK